MKTSPFQVAIVLAAALCVSACATTAVGTDATASADSADDAQVSLDAAAVDGAPSDALTADPKQLTVMTFNVMCSFCKNSEFPQWQQEWKVRLPMTKQTIARHDPDLIGVQELSRLVSETHEIDDLTQPENIYGEVSYHFNANDAMTDLGKAFEQDYPDATILYRKTRFDVLAQGQFWLSPTPDTAFSFGFAKNGGSFFRLVVWAKLHDKVANRDMYFATTHFDNNSPSQELSAPLALQRFEPKAKELPVIFIGDFNSTPANKAYVILNKGVDGKGFSFANAFDLAKNWSITTNRQPVPAYDLTQRIDHFWLAGAEFSVPWFKVDLWGYGANMQKPSDHDAMIAAIRW